jgi:hypothetical protein
MSQNGKGDSPRSCFSKQFKDNYSEINWKKTPKPRSLKQEFVRSGNNSIIAAVIAESTNQEISSETDRDN